MLNKTGKYIVPVFMTLVGVFFAVYSHMHYKFYSPTQGPMPGFMPEVLGVLLTISGLAALIQARNEPDKTLDPKNFTVVLAIGLVLIFNYLIGTLISIGLFLLIWLKFVSKNSWKTTLLVFALVMAFIYGIFVFWMDVPFTEGLFFEILSGR